MIVFGAADIKKLKLFLLINGSVAEWSNARDCKSRILVITLVRIQPGPLDIN